MTIRSKSESSRRAAAGYCVPYEEQPFAAAIVRLLQDPEAATAMGERGRRYVLEHRAYGVIADMVEKQLLGRSRVRMLNVARAKLCIVNPFEHGGGAEYQISLLIDALAATGRYEIYYLAHFVDDRDRSRNYRYRTHRNRRSDPALRVLDGCRIAVSHPAQDKSGADLSARRLRLHRDLRAVCAPPFHTHALACRARYRCHAAGPRPGQKLVRVCIWKNGRSDTARGMRAVSSFKPGTRRNYCSEHFARTADAIIPNFHPPASRNHRQVRTR